MINVYKPYSWDSIISDAATVRFLRLAGSKHPGNRGYKKARTLEAGIRYYAFLCEKALQNERLVFDHLELKGTCDAP
jgi:hypothetical protein